MVGVIVTSIIVFAFALIFWAVKARHNRIKKVDLYGVLTTGVVTNKPSVTSQHGVTSYGIVFEFEYDCQIFVKKIWGLDKITYGNAMIGMTYEVKYLPNSPKTAIIFTDRPMGKRADLQDDDNQQKKIFINRKRNRIIFALTMIMCFALLFWIGRTNRETKANIELYGIETVGTVIHKYRSDGTSGLRFEFEHNGETFVRNQTISRHEFENAIIGIQYVVKFLPDNPKRAIILIDKPVKTNILQSIPMWQADSLFRPQ